MLTKSEKLFLFYDNLYGYCRERFDNHEKNYNEKSYNETLALVISYYEKEVI